MLKKNLNKKPQGLVTISLTPVLFCKASCHL